jgi:hypothetical protein
MTDAFSRTLADGLRHLQTHVEQLNGVASLEGLLAAHFGVGHRQERLIDWHVYIEPAKWITGPDVDLNQAPQLAVLGCLLSEQAHRAGGVDSSAGASFNSHVKTLQLRQNVFSLPNSWALQSNVLLGIALGVKASNEPSAVTWLLSLLEEGGSRNNTPLLLKLIYAYAHYLLQTPNPTHNLAQIEIREDCSIAELAIAISLVRREIIKTPQPDRQQWLESACNLLVTRFLTEEPYEVQDYKVAVLWQVLTSYIEAHSFFPSTSVLSSALTNFAPAMERWNAEWLISDEYDVQDVLWLMLRPYFDDLRYEESLPKFGRSGHRYDIGIPQLGTVIEAKYIRKVGDFQKIVDEVGKDSAQLQTQSTFTRIVVFVYDETRSVEQHAWTRDALEQIALVQEAIIIAAPSNCRSKPKAAVDSKTKNSQI